MDQEGSSVKLKYQPTPSATIEAESNKVEFI